MFMGRDAEIGAFDLILNGKIIQIMIPPPPLLCASDLNQTLDRNDDILWGLNNQTFMGRDAEIGALI